MHACWQWTDTPERYGVISRCFHWGMALLFAWQFLGMGLRALLGRTPLVSFFTSTHGGIGALLLALVLLRALWGLFNLRRRPPPQAGTVGKLARIGHGLVYALMFVVPALALLRQYGSGRAFVPFGIPLMEAGPRIEWMVAPGNAAHGLLGWVLLVLIAGHIGMALVHRLVWRDGVLGRMAGR